MDGYVKIGTELDTKSFDAEIRYVESQLEEIEHKLKQADMSLEVGDTMKLEAQYSKLSKQLDRLQKKQADLNKTDLSNVQKSIDNIGKSTSNTIKHVARWALGIFAIESAYGFVRQAMSSVSQYNEQIATDVEYIRYALGSMLQPIIEGLIQLAFRLLTYVNYIAQAWFGVNLFANASSKSFEKNNKALGNSVKSAKELNKQIASFDEMNVLNDTSSNSGGGAGADAISLPSMDLSQWQGEVPEWVKWIAENKDIVIAGLLGIAGGLVAINLGLTAIQGIGVGIALAGIIIAIQSLIKFLQDPTFENFTNIIIGIGTAIIGVGIIISSFPLIITGVIAVIVATIVKNYDYIMGLFNKLINWFETDFIGALRYLFGPIGDIIAAPFIFAVNVMKSAFEGLFGGIRKIVTGIIQIFKGDFKNGFMNVFGGLKDILLAPFNALVSGINSLIRGVNRIRFDVPDWVPGFGGKKFGFNIPQIPRLAVGGIVNMPGRGVPIGGAIAGESGREGVIPLTDSQAMETLGQAIGRYITINANITNTMNGRVISRELQKINNNSDFAKNS